MSGTADRPTVLVAGNGMVGFRFCRELVERAPGRYRVVVFSEEERPAYDRVHLTALLQNRRLEDLLLAPRSWYERNGIELRLGDPLAAVDRRRGAARSRSGREQRFDTLVMATGAEPYVPSIPGNDHPGVFTYRNARDLLAIKLHARRTRRAAVLGGGLVGLEAAAALSALGVETTIVERAPHLLSRQLDPISADLVREQVERLGVRVACRQRATAIRRDDGHLLLDLDGGDELSTELVVLAAGVRPRDELARRAGLAIDDLRGGVAVDDQLATSDPRIMAIGDCARHAGTAYGLVGPGYEMARVAARRLAGEEAARFTSGDPACRLTVAGIQIAALGDHAGGGRPLVFQDGMLRRTLLLRAGTIVGLRAVGGWDGLAAAEQAMETRRPLTAVEIERFCRTGDLSPQVRTGRLTPTFWSDDDLVCQCARVRCGAIRCEVARGCTTVAQLGAATGAGTVCGGCQPTLAELCGDIAPMRIAAPRGRIAVAALSLGALAACAAALWIGPWQLAAEPPALRWLTRFWTADKLASGFALLGTAAVAMLFSMRRRLPGGRRSRRLGAWRVAHTAIGVAAIAVLGAHTGMHLGDNLNRALLVTFLAVLISGGLVGLAAARAGRARAPTGRLRRMLLAGHWLFLSALPVLLAFHVIAVYYF